jgi:pimeloyl-ACP methyl ester carboxylesterase
MNPIKLLKLLSGLALLFASSLTLAQGATKENPMKTVTSKDGTTIALEQSGKGPTLIIVAGAIQYRAFDQGLAQLAELLAPHFTVINYDRRGRGDSTDKQPYAVEREIEDIEALIDEAGGSAFVYGISSGAALAMEAATELPGKIKKLAMYEAPYNDDGAGRQAWKEYTKQLGELLAADRRGDAVALFMMLTGATAEQTEEMRQAPVWPMFEAVAPTLDYDHIFILGEEADVPTERAAQVTVPTLVMNGGASYPFMHVTAMALANAIPQAQHRTLEGQTHEVAAEAIAPVLIEFFAS